MTHSHAHISLEELPAAAVILDATGERLLEMNELARELLGVSRDDHAAVSGFLDATQREKLARALADDSGYIGTKGWTIARRDGSSRHLAIAGRRLADGRYLLVLNDRTADERLGEAFRDSETRWSHTAANVPGALFRYLIRPDGSDAVMYMSQGCEQLWELEADSIVVDASPMWAQVLDEDRPTMFASVQASARDLSVWDHSWRIETPSGKRKWLRGIGRPFRQPDGSVAWDTLILDVSEQREAEQHRLKLMEELEGARRMEAIGRLAGGVAHDFNNLLTIIMSGVDAALNGDGAGEPDRNELAQVMAAAGRASELTRQLLVLARQRPLERGVISLAASLEKMHPMLERLAGERVKVRLDVSGSVASVPWTATQLDQVMTNLVVNAKAAMPEGGELSIVARDLPGENTVTIIVRDSGIGMSPEVATRIFEPFFSTKGAQGTGLGLATVHGLVSQAGGRVAVETSPGTGTTFEIRVPVAQHHVIGATESVGSVPIGRGEGILVVDDEPEVLRLTSQTLAQLGYRVHTAASAEQAMATLQSEGAGIAALVTDTVMPHIGGPELVAAAHARWPSLKVLFMSGYLAEGVDPEGVLASGARMLPKPFGRGALARAVREALDA